MRRLLQWNNGTLRQLVPLPVLFISRLTAFVFCLLGCDILWAQTEPAIPPSSCIAADQLWYWEAPYGITLVWLFAGLLITAVLIFGMYRLLLKNQIQRGMHPHILGWTLSLFFISFYLILSVFFLYHACAIGLGTLVLIASVLLLLLIIMLMLGKVMRVLWLFVLIAVAFLIFQWFNPISS